MIRNGQELLATLMDQVGYQAADRHGRPLHPLIIQYNRIASTNEDAASLILGEIEELSEEQQRHPLSESWWLELADVLVTLRSARDRFAPQFSIRETTFSVNGQWKGNFKSLKEQTVNLAEGNPHHNFQLLITELLSMLKHLDTDIQGKIYLRLSKLVVKLNSKLERNKESKYCQIEPGMDDTDVYNKTIHVFKAFRKIRNFLKQITGAEQTLEPRITVFFESEIMDWRNSEEALTRLEQKLPLLRATMKDSLAWLLSGKLTPQVYPDKQLLQATLLTGKLPPKKQLGLELDLMIAGGVPLRYPEGESVSATGQKNKTIFWV